MVAFAAEGTIQKLPNNTWAFIPAEDVKAEVLPEGVARLDANVQEVKIIQKFIPATASFSTVNIGATAQMRGASFPSSWPSKPSRLFAPVTQVSLPNSTPYYNLTTGELLVRVDEGGYSTRNEFLVSKVYYKDGRLEEPRTVCKTPYQVIKVPSPTGNVYYWPTGYNIKNIALYDRIEVEYITWWTSQSGTLGYIWVGAQVKYN